MAMCDMCENYRYDEDLEEYFCDIELDEDEYLKFLTSSNDACPYFRADDDYRIGRQQNSKELSHRESSFQLGVRS